IFIDPSPMKDARAMALNIRRSAKSYPYIILMTPDEDIDSGDVMQMGCNDFVQKPFDQADIHKKVDNAQRLKDLFDNLGDTSEDFPSAGGVISKSAFNQLCLSAMERGGRYNELAFVLAIAVENYKDIKNLDGSYVANYSVSKMAHHMVRLRRQSDIIGQTGVNEYSILLQRTQNLTEAMDAARRFAATFDEIDDFLPAEGKEITIRIMLTHLPTGAQPFYHELSKKVSVPAG
ncbi:MAG TPA: diguanylate cyclase, partial [Alphaproteobacteria bacterium]|nr:diguanylate cyclase [Alphaproteobacteria bacterium]